MKMITLPARFNPRSLEVGLLDRVARNQGAPRALPVGRGERGNLGQRIEDGLMLTLALTGFGSIGWSLCALW